MAIDDFFRARLEQMIDLRHPLAVLAGRMPWSQIEAALAPVFERKNRQGQVVEIDDLFGTTQVIAGAVVSAAGRARLPIRLMASLLYLKHAFNLSDEELVARWSENVVWQYFGGQAYYTPKLPCDATQIGRFRTAIGKAGVDALLKATIDTAVQSKAVTPKEFERVIVDTTVQEKAIAHARQFRRLRRAVKRQRTILGIVLREIRRKLTTATTECAASLDRLNMLLERAERIHKQQPKDKNKLYALHAPEVECIGKGKARKPYEFGVKASITVTHKQGLIVGAKTFPGNPYDGHILHEQLEQTNILLEGSSAKPKQVVVDLGFRGANVDNPNVEIIHRGKHKSLTKQQLRWLKRRQAVEPAIGHLKSDHRMDRCWLQGKLGDALHAVLCAMGYNLRWLLRAMVRLGLKAAFLRILLLQLVSAIRGKFTTVDVNTPHAKSVLVAG